MWKWLKSRIDPQEKPAESALKGAPGVPRTKTYSADSGYVYQYVYRGYRRFADSAPGTDYIFSVSRDRKTVFPVTIRLRDSALADCAETSGREILNVEQYALAKMALFAGFDRIDAMEEWRSPLTPNGSEMANYLRTLGRI